MWDAEKVHDLTTMEGVKPMGVIARIRQNQNINLRQVIDSVNWVNPSHFDLLHFPFGVFKGYSKVCGPRLRSLFNKKPC